MYRTRSFTSASAASASSASAPASTSTSISSVQKGNNFEKSVLEKLKYLPNLSCKKVQ